MVTVLVVAGAGSTAICADLGSRTIREEIDAMKVLGIDPSKGSAFHVYSPRPSSRCSSTVSSPQ